ncbi:MAG: flagellar hook capping protein [Sphingomonas bacterium]|jgi:flagellar basal-body rod modification protein FlgD|nr:flagellar hook capping protein [Sphingomonas bacterium]
MTVSNTSTDTSYVDSLRAQSAATAVSTAASSSTIDQAGFLKLLTAQMTNQDPTAPMDTNTMVQQLSEMSSVSGITEMNSSMKSLVSELTGNRIGDAASWIGKAALLSSSAAMPLSNGGYAGEITLPSDASSVNVSLVDASGATVNTQTLGAQSAGTIDFSWDGTKTDGTKATGPLKVVVSAAGTTGAITPTVSTWATVTGVQSPAGGSSAELTTTLGTVAPTDVLSLS